MINDGAVNMLLLEDLPCFPMCSWGAGMVEVPLSMLNVACPFDAFDILRHALEKPRCLGASTNCSFEIYSWVSH